MATKCLAAICREKPSDPIVHGKRYEMVNRQIVSYDTEEMRTEEEKPNYFRPDFNVPSTMRGIKSLSIGIKDQVVDPMIEEAEDEGDDLLQGLEPAKNDEQSLRDIEKDFENF